VDAPGGFTNTNPFFDSDVTGWTASGCTVARSTAFVMPSPVAVASMLITPDGVTAAGGATSSRTATATINPGGLYTVSLWVYSPIGHSDFAPVVDWYTSGDAYISTGGLGSGLSVPAAVWTLLEQTVTAPATASKAAMRARFGTTPPSSTLFYLYGVRISRQKASVIYDDFGRTSTDTWDSADSGQAWTNTGTAADYDVLSGYGRHINPATSAAHHSVIASVDADSDMYVSVTTAALSTGASQFTGPLARYADGDNLYQARVEFTTANAVVLSIRERVAAVETQLGTYTTGLTHVAGTNVRVRFQVIGSALKAKAWLASRTEPSAWHIEVTDTSLTAAGSTGVKSVRNAGNTNANAEFRYDNLDLRNPQTFTVTRSHNGVVKAQSAGAAVKLRHPAIIAL